MSLFSVQNYWFFYVKVISKDYKRMTVSVCAKQMLWEVANSTSLSGFVWDRCSVFTTFSTVSVEEKQASGSRTVSTRPGTQFLHLGAAISSDRGNLCWAPHEMKQKSWGTERSQLGLHSGPGGGVDYVCLFSIEKNPAFDSHLYLRGCSKSKTYRLQFIYTLRT